MQTDSNIKGVIFDLGNVLLDFDHFRAARRIAKFCDKTGEEIYGLFFDSHLTADFEEGKISPLKFFEGVRDTLCLKISFEEFVPIWNEIFYFSEKNLGVYNLALKLKNRYRLALLSNINVLHFDFIKETFPILDAFHNIITSCAVGLRKPHAEIYQKALEILKTKPEETFYTDDRADLIESAKLLGIKSFVFTDVVSLEKNLLEQKVDIN